MKAALTISIFGVFILVLLTACDAASAPDRTAVSDSNLGGGLLKGRSGRTWREGVNFDLLPTAVRTPQRSGKIEVLEFFQYGCGHCNLLEPYLIVWTKGAQDVITFTRIPVTYKPEYRSYATLYYALQSLGRISTSGANDLHHEIYDTVHRVGNPLIAGSREQESFKVQLEFAMKFGIPAGVFESAYRSPAVTASVKRAEFLGDLYRIDRTPMIVVAGKYKTSNGMAGGPDRLLTLISDLAFKEREDRKSTDSGTAPARSPQVVSNQIR